MDKNKKKYNIKSLIISFIWIVIGCVMFWMLFDIYKKLN